MIQLMALYFFIGLALAAGITAYNRLDAHALYQLEKLKIAYEKGEWKEKIPKFKAPSFRRVKASAV